MYNSDAELLLVSTYSRLSRCVENILL